MFYFFKSKICKRIWCIFAIRLLLLVFTANDTQRMISCSGNIRNARVLNVTTEDLSKQ